MIVPLFIFSYLLLGFSLSLYFYRFAFGSVDNITDVVVIIAGSMSPIVPLLFILVYKLKECDKGAIINFINKLIQK